MKKVCLLGMDFAGKSTILPLLVKELEKHNKNVAVVKSTHSTIEQRHNDLWRQQLVSEETTNLQRFNAALMLYESNMNLLNQSTDSMIYNKIDFLLIERGFSDLAAYNRVYPLDTQIKLIPDVDFAFYIRASWDVLNARAAKRISTDFQDTDTKFREKIFNEGPNMFEHFSRIKINTVCHFVDTSTESPLHHAQTICELLLV